MIVADSIKVFFPDSMANVQVSYTCASLCRQMAEHVPVRIHTSAVVRGYRDPIVVPAVHPFLTHWGYSYLRKWMRLQERVERQFCADVSNCDLAWLWPKRVVPTARRLREAGIRMVAEVINCHQATARRILEDGYRRAGLPARHKITDERIEHESELYRLVDAVFSPSPMVTASLVENGVSEAKIIDTSYGWAPELMPEHTARGHSEQDITVISVGTICVRKGQHLLARAWADAGVRGELHLVGWMSDDFRGREGELILVPSVRLIGPVKPGRVGHLMQGADIFAFPTLEESGPQVTYEAASQGLAILTTPMGAGRVVRNGIDGIVVDPYDHDAWVRSLRRLARDADLRARLGYAAKERAKSFTWQAVAEQRIASLRTRGLIGTPGMEVTPVGGE